MDLLVIVVWAVIGWGFWKLIKWLASPQVYKIELPEDYEIRKKKKKWYE